MKSKAVFYHAGCPVCVDAEQRFATGMDPSRFAVEVVHLGKDKSKLGDAQRAGVKSVPAMVVDGQVYHINFGASLADVEKG
jgi:glutaredoxin